MDRHDNDRNMRLRNILKRMERSIDDARARRTTGDEPEIDGPGADIVVGGPTTGSRPGTAGFDPLDTPIADSRPASSSSSTTNGPVRDRETMFDFEGPRLKARPKRRSAS